MPFKNKGLTLVELLVAIVLLSLLTGVSSFLGLGHFKKARDARRKADLEKIKVALYDYYFDKNCFPKNLPGCGQNLDSSGVIYLNNFPCDPSQKISYGYQVQEGECGQWFKILANLENTQDPDIKKVGCSAGCGPNCEFNYGLSSTNIKVNQDCVTYYACTPSGECVAFEDPQTSRCPLVFENDSTCNNACLARENRCHDERGKRVPYIEGPTLTPKQKKSK